MTDTKSAVWLELCDAMDRLLAMKASGDALFTMQKRMVDGLCDRARKAGVDAKLIEACTGSHFRFGCCGSCMDPDECELTKRDRLICLCGAPKHPASDGCTTGCV